jgi:16S rRNA (cytidine1402-2'-O)-methyltransferase
MGNTLITGNLYLVPTVLGETPVTDVLPEKTITAIHAINYFIVEELRTARRFLRSAGVKKSFDTGITLSVFNEHSGHEAVEECLAPLFQGHDVGILSEAGVPCVADPGSPLIRAAHNQGVRVIPLTGPSSILLALMASGFNGQNFTFHGYLPVEDDQRSKKLREIEKTARDKDQTQIFIETPYRNQKMFEAILQVCSPATRLCIAVDLTLPGEMILARTVKDWKGKTPDIQKRPAVFLLY